MRCACGGIIRVKDWGRPGEFRFEAWCARCLECDPNGYASRAKAAAGAREYFLVIGAAMHRKASDARTC